MNYSKIFLISILILSQGCKKEDEPVEDVPPVVISTYFPPTISDQWESLSPDELNWDSEALDELYAFLENSETRGFIILKNGKIVVEEYWGMDFLNLAPFDQNKTWYWASAGKTITAMLVGKAQEDGLLNIEDKTSDYLGENWTSMPIEKENLIKVRHQLEMTTGVEYNLGNFDCTDPECMVYREDAGDLWYYHNATYTLLKDVLENATGIDLNTYTDNQVGNKIGMYGNWIITESNNLYFSTTREAARFGLLLSEDCKWGNTDVLTDANYIHAMKNSSQDLNPSYGYLTWLNGKESIILPSLPLSFNLPLSSNAPEDLYAAMGKNGQFIDVVPSEGIVVVRFGNSPDESFVPTTYHNDMWEKIMAMLP